MTPQQVRSVKILLALAGVIVLVGLIVVAARMGAIGRRADRIAVLQTQIAAERSRCQQLEIALNERGNLDMIRDAASTRLGMYEAGTDVQVVSLPHTADETEIVVYDSGE